MTDGARDDSPLRNWIQSHLGTDVTSLEPIEAGLGLRRFFRVHLAGPPGVVIARVEAPEDPAGRPPGVPPEPPQEPIRALLAEHGLPVPRRHAGNGTIELLEDLGDVSLEQLARENPERLSSLYEEIIADIATLQRIQPVTGVDAFERHLSSALFDYKAELFSTWSLPLVLGRPAEPEEIAQVRQAFAWIATECEAAPTRLAHRDLQSRNLLVQKARVRWIDFQGAFMAPPEYDLVCLLCDSYVELPDGLREELLAFARTHLPGPLEKETSQKRFDLLTLTRKGKDHARFVYALRERGDRRQLPFLPGTTRTLKRAASATRHLAPELAILADWIAELPEDAGALR